MQVGDIYLNTKTKVESIILDIRDSQIIFARTDNAKRKFQLTLPQMTNMIRVGPPDMPKFYVLPTTPEFLNDDRA